MSEHDVTAVPQCPHCEAPIKSPAGTCWTCGHEIATDSLQAFAIDREIAADHEDATDHAIATSETDYTSETAYTTVEPDGPDQIPLIDWQEPEQMPAHAQIREAVAAADQPKSWSLALVGGAGVLACVVTLVILQSLQPAASPQPAETVPPAAPQPVAAAPVAESAPAPTWVGNRQATWANDGSKTISFELQSTRDVNVWMSRVRPLLVVRCLYRTTEVFVAIQSAASIEGQSGSHTVQVQIDDDQPVAQQWTDSMSGQELFAPNSVTLARRLASAERLRFSFTPYNAKPVTAEFAVHGFDKLAGLVGNTCGWKVDESGKQPRMAKLR